MIESSAMAPNGDAEVYVAPAGKYQTPEILQPFKIHNRIEAYFAQYRTASIKSLPRLRDSHFYTSNKNGCYEIAAIIQRNTAGL